ncbi:MAG: hypothetical protein ACFCUP_00150 [Actinomycetales bacterium]
MSLTLAWDATALVHAVACDRLDVLGDLAAGPVEESWRNVTTTAVWSEVRDADRPPGWLEVVHVDDLPELQALFRWQARLSSGVRDLGETTVPAWADVHGATAIIDDTQARRVAARHGAAVHGSLWVVAQAVRAGRCSATSASAFVDVMGRSGFRLPFPTGDFVEWAKASGLL